MEIETLLKKIDSTPARSAWAKGVKNGAISMLESALEDMEELYIETAEKDLLNGAENWQQWAGGGCGLVYNYDIARAYCSPSELKRVKHGSNPPNSRETWIDVEARAAFQAWKLIENALKS